MLAGEAFTLRQGTLMGAIRLYLGLPSNRKLLERPCALSYRFCAASTGSAATFRVAFYLHA